jgi:hypothetical protein
MNPQAGQGENPYLAFLQKLQGQGGQQAPGNSVGPATAMQHAMQPAGASQPGGNPISALAQTAGGAPGAQQPDIEDAAMPGQNPGVSKNLMGAMNQLHGAITQMTDPQEIRMVRSIIVLLNQLIQRDQEVQNQRTGTMQPQQPGESNLNPGVGAQHSGFPTGQPAGAPSPAA